MISADSASLYRAANDLVDDFPATAAFVRFLAHKAARKERCPTCGGRAVVHDIACPSCEAGRRLMEVRP